MKRIPPNLPNRLTIARLLMTLIFLGLISIPEFYVDDARFYWRIGFIIAILAGVTDFFDGYLARKYDVISEFGKVMDPLTDKIFVVGSLVILTEKQIVPGWITILILTREFIVMGLRVMAANTGTIIAADKLARLKTVLQMLLLALGAWILVELPGGEMLKDSWYWTILLYLIAALTVYSGIEYLIKHLKFYKKDI